MYSSKLGRFSTTDPMYFQVVMVVDPQRFNLYGYARNNPLMWNDPNGEEIRVAQGSSMDQLYKSVGGQEIFDQYFEVNDGMVTCRAGVDCSSGNQGVQFINELVGRSETFLVYLGADSSAVAKLFAGTTNDDGSLTKEGKRIQKVFEANGYIVNTRDRPGQAGESAGDVFTVLATNPEAFNYEQGGVASSSFGITEDEARIQAGGIGQRVRPVSLLIHELAENLDFARNGTGSQVTAPDKKLKKNKATKALYEQELQVYNNRGGTNYNRAHYYGIRKEILIRGDANVGISGGFAGGNLRRP